MKDGGGWGGIKLTSTEKKDFQKAYFEPVYPFFSPKKKRKNANGKCETQNGSNNIIRSLIWIILPALIIIFTFLNYFPGKFFYQLKTLDLGSCYSLEWIQ